MYIPFSALFCCYSSSFFFLYITFYKSIFTHGCAARDFSFLRRKKRRPRSETHEPSSPKVTCIGQVRVKSKKNAKQCRSLSQRRNNLGEVSFRKGEDKDKHHHHHHQRWFHLPISTDFIFTCCRCESREKWCEKNSGCGCGCVFGKKREIEDDEEEEEEEMVSIRRHVFDDIEVRDGRIEVRGVRVEDGGERESICIPPKNALLLMRCRSDPMKMAALVNKFSSNVVDSESEERGELEEEEEEKEEEEEEEERETEVQDQIFNKFQEQEMTGENVEEIETSPDQEMQENKESQTQSPSTANMDRENENDVVKEKDSPVLPECLLLMMREPKLSMEISKETWVRGADFLRWLPPPKAANSKPPTCCHHQLVRRKSNPDSKPKLVSKKSDPPHPPRSSCSLPNSSAAAGAVDQFILTRCKSEPMRTAEDKLMPETEIS